MTYFYEHYFVFFFLFPKKFFVFVVIIVFVVAIVDIGKVKVESLSALHYCTYIILAFFIITIPITIFTESAHWADSVIELRCPCVCMYVPCEEDLSFHWRGLLHIPPNRGLGVGGGKPALTLGILVSLLGFSAS